MNMNEKVSFNTTKKNLERLKALSTENEMPIGRFLKQQLENYFDENNLIQTEEIKFDKSLNVVNLSPKAKVALEHLYNEMFDKIIDSNGLNIALKRLSQVNNPISSEDFLNIFESETEADISDEIKVAIKFLKDKGFSNRVILVNCVREVVHEDEAVQQALSVLEKEFVTFDDKDFDRLVKLLYNF
ncbi:hypothetical protein ABC382_00290 [Lysinibacillus sp. 1P01SD]|uniref:hypothetical protein n=1 Tax=Lysinibacillus sp. 1P01SD TaxID=3132285 RepID=UPI0039A3BEAB